MKTIEEFIREIDGSEALQQEFENIKDEGGLVGFLKKYDCEATAEEFAGAIKDRAEGFITDDDAETAAGGVNWNKSAWEQLNDDNFTVWCPNCKMNSMRKTYFVSKFLGLGNQHYQCSNGCGRDVWESSIGTTGVTCN